MEPQVRSEGKAFPGGVTIQEREQALAVASGQWDNRNTIWTDGSRLDSGDVGAACAWFNNGEWVGRGFCLGSNKEVFDAETFAIYQAPSGYRASTEGTGPGEEVPGQPLLPAPRGACSDRFLSA